MHSTTTHCFICLCMALICTVREGNKVLDMVFRLFHIETIDGKVQLGAECTVGRRFIVVFSSVLPKVGCAGKSFTACWTSESRVHSEAKWVSAGQQEHSYAEYARLPPQTQSLPEGQTVNLLNAVQQCSRNLLENFMNAVSLVVYTFQSTLTCDPTRAPSLAPACVHTVQYQSIPSLPGSQPTALHKV